MVEVIVTDEFSAWYDELSSNDAESVGFVVGMLEEHGVSLGFPYSSKLLGSQSNLRELRIKSGGRPLRVAYSFDLKRQAVLLIGGDKTGDDRFYERFLADAEKILMQYLKEQAAGMHDKE